MVAGDQGSELGVLILFSMMYSDYENELTDRICRRGVWRLFFFLDRESVL